MPRKPPAIDPRRMLPGALDLATMNLVNVADVVELLTTCDVLYAALPTPDTFVLVKGEKKLRELRADRELTTAVMKVNDDQLPTLVWGLELIEAGKLDAGMIAAVGDRLAALACDPGMPITTPKYGSLDGMPVRYNDGEAWVYADNSWQRDFAEVHTEARRLNANDFAKWFGPLPALPSAAFQPVPSPPPCC